MVITEGENAKEIRMQKRRDGNIFSHKTSISNRSNHRPSMYVGLAQIHVVRFPI